MQSKTASAISYVWKFRVTDTGSRVPITDGKTVTIASTGGIALSKPTTYKMLIDGSNIITSWLDPSMLTGSNSGSLMVSTGNLGAPANRYIGVGELPQGTDNYVLTVKKEANEGMAWEAAAGTDYCNAATFNTGDGIITVTGVGSAGFTVDIDNRYPSYHSGLPITNYVTYWANANKVSGSVNFQFDGTDVTIANDLNVANITGSGDLTSDGAITHQTRTITTVSPPATPVLERMSASDYHLHIINTHDPGVTQDVKLPIASAGREVIITTECELAPGAGGTKVVDLSVEGTNPLENINRTLTSTTLNSNGSENYSIYKFTVLEDGFTWAGAKMGYVT